MLLFLRQTEGDTPVCRLNSVEKDVTLLNPVPKQAASTVAFWQVPFGYPGDFLGIKGHTTNVEAPRPPSNYFARKWRKHAGRSVILIVQQATRFIPILLALIAMASMAAGQDSTLLHEKRYKNVVRYNLSGALLFGIDNYIVFGYERVIGRHQSMSLNIGKAGLPKLFSIVTDSFSLSKDRKNTGFNVSLDYRFYLAKENKYDPPHGLYIGPFISYNDFKRENDWNSLLGGSANQAISTSSELKILTIGGELGYQFVLWKRLALDLVLIGPGISRYDLKTEIGNTLSNAAKTQIQSAIKQIITQRFPGMNYVFSDKQFDKNGTIGTWDVGFRYLIHIGFLF
jgi:hypothetical protein